MSEPARGRSRLWKWTRRIVKSLALLALVVFLSLWGYARYEFRSRIGDGNFRDGPGLSLVGEFGKAEGWKERPLMIGRNAARRANFTSVVVMHKGKVAAEWGQTERVSSLHSGRKSVLSLLYGVAADKGLIDLDATLADVGVAEEADLNEVEAKATIRDLLMAKSGVYLPARGETKSMKRNKPPRGSHKPGEFWLYNNWDFNALGVIFERQTGMTIGDALNDWLAGPLGMQDFRPEHVRMFSLLGEGVHPQYIIGMSGRDLARVGVMALNGGKWGDEQVVPAEYLKASTSPLTPQDADLMFDSYGYSWWVGDGGNRVAAVGYGRQLLLIDRERELVVVTRVNTGVNYFEWFLWGTPLVKKPLAQDALMVLFVVDKAYDW